MNKNRHRIVFNEHRGQFMAVSEVDVSQGEQQVYLCCTPHLHRADA